MNIKRILALALAALMMIPALAACNEETPDDPFLTDPSDISDSAPDDTVPEETGLVLGKTDFGGAVLRVISVDESYNFGYYVTDDIWIEEDSSDPFEASVYKRLQDCKEKYNFTVSFTTSTGPMNDVASMVAGGLDQCDLAFAPWISTWDASKTGNLIDMREMPTVDLSNSWWDQNANEQLTVANRLFYTAGDLYTADDRCTRALYFNKDLAESKSLANPYELVRSNQWTFDKFAEMCRSVYQDVDGGGTTDEDDIIGMFYEGGQFSYLMTAMGEHHVQLDENGLPVYSYLATSEAVTKMETIAGLLIDEKVTYDVADYKNFGAYTNAWTYARSKFAAGKHLFSLGGALVIKEFADMEDSFGIVPMPKWNPEQSRYYHVIDSSAPLMTVPNTKVDTTDLGYMLEYFSYEGQQTVVPTYKEKMLKRRYAQDTDSADMLDIIYANKCYDVYYVGRWANVIDIANKNIAAGRIPTMSAYNRAAKTIPGLIQKDFDKLALAGKATAE